MLRALSEYVIGGLITNISFLKIIINHPSFKKGDFNINFLNDEFMNSIKNFGNNKDMSEIEKTAAIFAAVLKANSSVNNLRDNHTKKTNLWQEQLYE